MIGYHLTMVFGRYGKFSGGIDLPDEKHATLDQPIQPFSPSLLRVPLAHALSRTCKPLVEPDQTIQAGECIGRDGGTTTIFSPLAGKVVSLCSAEIAPGDEFTPCPAIEIDPQGSRYEMAMPKAAFDWRAASASTLRQRIADGALTTYRRPIRSLSGWLEAARAAHCRTVVANVMESQPFVTAAHRTLVDFGPQVIAGLSIIRQAIEAPDAILVADRRRTGDYQQIVGPARIHGVSRIALPHKYPMGSDAMLLKVLTRREAPPGGSTLKAGLAMIDVATCLAVYRWVACELPSTGRVVTVAGPRVAEPGNYWVPFGTRCLELAGQDEQPVIQNGPMVGVRCSYDSVVTPATDAVLALEAAVPAPPGACIRCGWCTDHCPARLNVSALNDAYELGLLERARQLVAPACVECGVCTYVCPARLPLSQRVKQFKRAIQGMGRSMPLFHRSGRGDAHE